jgi:hypothetical protein
MQSRMVPGCRSQGGLVTARAEKEREELRRMEEERRERARRANDSEEQRKTDDTFAVRSSLLAPIT